MTWCKEKFRMEESLGGHEGGEYGWEEEPESDDAYEKVTTPILNPMDSPRCVRESHPISTARWQVNMPQML